ncbi:MAG: amino acid ABC transporter substrate-binding protein [Clostridia bacterium]|nr:amino acid ABC transporter substrate-binding protein [Clostridia bacterium]
MKKVSLLLLIILIISLSGCAQTEENNEIFLGVAWPFEKSEDLFEEGIDLALEEINKNGGINGKELKLLKRDDEGQLNKAMLIAQEFADTENIKAVIGHKNSFISIPVSAIYEEAGVVMLSPTSTAPELLEKGYKNIFRMIPDDNMFAERIASYIADQGHHQMVIYYTDDSYGIGLANSFEDKAKEYGVTVVDRFKYYGDKNDLVLLEKRWKAYGYDGIFIATTAEEGAKFIKTAQEANINIPFYAGNSLDSHIVRDIAGEFAEELVVASVFDKKNEDPVVQNFIRNFSEKYGEIPDSYASLGYDSLQRIANAISNQKSSGSENLYKELELLENAKGASGGIVVLKKLTQGNFEVIK